MSRFQTFNALERRDDSLFVESSSHSSDVECKSATQVDVAHDRRPKKALSPD